MQTITLTVDEDDSRAIHEAIAKRQAWRVIPQGDGDLAGRLLAEICRGWAERIEREGDVGDCRDIDDEESLSLSGVEWSVEQSVGA